MGSLSIDSQSIQLNGQAYFLEEVFSPEISSPKVSKLSLNFDNSFSLTIATKC